MIPSHVIQIFSTGGRYSKIYLPSSKADEVYSALVRNKTTHCRSGVLLMMLGFGCSKLLDLPVPLSFKAPSLLPTVTQSVIEEQQLYFWMNYRSVQVVFV